jgi:cytochrome b6-f complex iron-sulfur subunit
MTTTTAPNKAASARTEAATAANVPDVQVKPINRREFLYYIWGASVALLLAQSGGAIIWFALPRFRAGEFGGVFTVDPALVPAVGAPPAQFSSGKFWLSNTANGAIALSMVCTHLGCLYKWVDSTNRFECPCHGSKFTGEGKYIEGPAPRSLDYFEITTSETALLVNTGKKIKGDTHA